MNILKQKWWRYVCMMLLVCSFLTGCNQTNSAPLPSGKIYQNKAFGFQFTLPKDAHLTVDGSTKKTGKSDPLYAIVINYGGTPSIYMNIFNRDADREELQNIINGKNPEGYKKMILADGTEYWQAGPTKFSDYSYVMGTVFFGKDYIYSFDSGFPAGNKVYEDRHNAIIQSFKFLSASS